MLWGLFFYYFLVFGRVRVFRIFLWVLEVNYGKSKFYLLIKIFDEYYLWKGVIYFVFFDIFEEFI